MAANADRGAPEPDPDWPVPIAVLAERVQMSPRNIRAYQTRGIIPPPVRQGRIACYDRRHEAVLLRIKELQQRGYSLAAVAEALTASKDVSLLQRLVLAPLLEGDEVVLAWPEIAGMFDQQPDEGRYRRAVAAGLVTVADNGQLIAPSATLLGAAREVMDLGVPFQEVFDLQVAVAETSKPIARRFVAMCLERALSPFSGEVPPERWPEVTARFEELYRLMASILAASFTVSVRRAAAALLEDQEQSDSAD